MTEKNGQILFFSMIGDWFEKGIGITCSESTVEAYRDALTVFRRYVGDIAGISLRTFTFENCTYDFLLDYRNWLAKTAEYAATTVNQRVAALKSYLRYAASRDISLLQMQLQAERVPALKEPKRRQAFIEDREAVRAILEAPQNTRLGRRDAAILTVLFDSAIRVSELTELRVRDTVPDAGVPRLLIHGKGRKERIATLSDPCAAILSSYLEEYHPERIPTDFLFFTVSHGVAHPMSRRNVERIVCRYGDIARDTHPSVPQNLSPHVLRRTRACLLYHDGVPIEVISLFLGHENIQTTIDHYAFPSLAQKREAMSKGTEGTIPGLSQKPEWPVDNDEFARMCGLR